MGEICWIGRNFGPQKANNISGLDIHEGFCLQMEIGLAKSFNDASWIETQIKTIFFRSPHLCVSRVDTKN